VHPPFPAPAARPQKGSGKLGYEAEAFAIYDTMRYIKPPVATVCVGSAFGEAAMLLAAGEPGRRAALPSTSIMIRQPMQRFTQMQASDIDIYRNELRKTNAEVVRRKGGRGPGAGWPAGGGALAPGWHPFGDCC
jgi:ATP-dependent Clp protease protease subunit